MPVQSTHRQAPGGRRCGSNGSLANYAAAALQRECDLVAEAIEGTRHDTLRDSALRIAGLAKAGTLDWEICRDRLTEAGEKCGLPSGEVRELIDSAWDKATPTDLA